MSHEQQMQKMAEMAEKFRAQHKELKVLEEEALNRLIRIRSGLILTQPFFGALSLKLKLMSAVLVFDGEKIRLNTMATDGVHLLYSPLFIKTLTDAELRAVFCHEILHCALGHPWRVGERDKDVFGQACDYAINPILDEEKFSLPKGGLLRKEFKGWDAEKIYIQLMTEQANQPKSKQGKGGGKDGEGDDEGEGDGDGKGQGKGKGKGKPGTGQGQDSSFGDLTEMPWGAVLGKMEESEAEAAEQQAEWKVATAQAATAAKMQGTLPGDLERLVEEALRNKVDWKSVLRRFMQQAAKADYSWKMPSARYASMGLYLPCLKSETMPPVVIVVDTSGSIGGEELNLFGKEIDSVVAECKPELTHVVYCDARVAHVQEFQPGDPIKLEPRGGGGTDMTKALDWVEKNEINPACVIVLTDGYTPFGESREYPTLWAITTKGLESPWGESLYLGDDWVQ